MTDTKQTGLSDERIEILANMHRDGIGNVIYGYFAKAIESEVSAPLLARIAELEKQTAEQSQQNFILGSTEMQIFYAIDGAHWLGGPLHERINKLIANYELIQLERNELKQQLAQQPASKCSEHPSKCSEQPAEQAPVAWRIFDGEGGYSYRNDNDPPSSADIKWSAQYGRKYEPLYLAPQPAEQALDDTTANAIQRACHELPAGWIIVIDLEKDAGTVSLFDPVVTRIEYGCDFENIAEEINAAVNAALGANG